MKPAMSLIIPVAALGISSPACTSQEYELTGHGVWADDEDGMAVVTERTLVERGAFETGGVQDEWFTVWTQNAADERPRRLADERRGNPARLYFMKQPGYLVVNMSGGGALIASTEDGAFAEIPAAEGETDFVPSRDGTLIASAHSHGCTSDSPRTCQVSIVFRDASTFEVIEETVPKQLRTTTRETVLWTRDGRAVLTDGTVTYEATPGDGDTRLPAIEVPCLWAPTSSFYVNSDGMFIDVAVEDERPVVTLRSTDDPTATCPVP